LPTPNGLAELATCLSDNLTFEDMFDHGSRRGSVSISSNGLGRGLMAGTKQHAAVLRLAPAAAAAACSSSGQPDVAVCPNANHQMQVLSSCTPASPDDLCSVYRACWCFLAPVAVSLHRFLSTTGFWHAGTSALHPIALHNLCYCINFYLVPKSWPCINTYSLPPAVITATLLLFPPPAHQPSG
jgi:hypothetical protein